MGVKLSEQIVKKQNKTLKPNTKTLRHPVFV